MEGATPTARGGGGSAGSGDRMMGKEEYLGRGLYASFDGWDFQLRAPRDGGDHIVVLDRRVLVEFQRFVARALRAQAAEDA